MQLTVRLYQSLYNMEAIGFYVLPFVLDNNIEANKHKSLSFYCYFVFPAQYLLNRELNYQNVFAISQSITSFIQKAILNW